MPPRSNWPNEDMWVRAVELRKSGLTYPQVTGRLVSEFNLEEIPSVDTVRRQVGVRLEVDSGSSALLTNHLIQLRWLASRVLAETGLDLVHLFSGDGVDVGRRLSAGFGDSALRIDRMPSRPEVSLVVEERQDFFLLTEHLSTIMPLSEAPDTLAKAMTRIGSIIESQREDRDIGASSEDAAVVAGQILIPATSFDVSFAEWKRKLSGAVEIAITLEDGLQRRLREAGEQIVEPGELRTVKEGISSRYVETIIASVCGRELPECDPLEVRDGKYELGSGSHSLSGEALFELRFSTPQGQIYVLLVSPDQGRVEELKKLHQTLRKELEVRPEVSRLVLVLGQAMVLERRIREELGAAVMAADFPGNCRECR